MADQFIRPVYENKWFSIEEIATHPVLDDEPYYRLNEASGVICVVVTEPDHFAMVRQWRPTLNTETLEFPAGQCEPGETTEQAVRREVLEETGVEITDLMFIGSGHPLPNRVYCEQAMFVGCGTRSRRVHDPEPQTQIELVRRADLYTVLSNSGLHCVAGIGALRLAELSLSMDLISASVGEIRKRLSSRSAA